jgi:ribonuclease P protein component
VLDHPRAVALRDGLACIAVRHDTRSVPASGMTREPRRTQQDEAHISTQRSPSRQEARFPRPHEYSSRSRGPQVPPRKGPRAALGLIHRVRTRREFSLLSSGRRVRTELLWCTHSLDDSLPSPQLAFAIGRGFGSAVHRNRARRRLRSAILARHASNPLLPGRYLVGITRSINAHTFPSRYRVIESEVAELLEKTERCSNA